MSVNSAGEPNVTSDQRQGVVQIRRLLRYSRVNKHHCLALPKQAGPVSSGQRSRGTPRSQPLTTPVSSWWYYARLEHKFGTLVERAVT